MASGRGSYFEIPHAVVYFLITANIVAYGWCLSQSNGASISADVLFRSGAMYSQALERHEYWRLLASGFLHFDLLHLATNMLCLALWGGHLEKRIGSTYFLVIFVGAVILGAVASNFAHSGRYLGAGASGGVSGILGALLCLWILGKIDLTASFFVTNIGLNVVLSSTASNIDWAAHLGGFVAGVIVCALIDAAEKLMHFIFRSKFPEFVKLNGLVLASGIAVLLWIGQPATSPSVSTAGLALLAYAAAGFVVFKSIDLVLPVKKGLAVVVVTFAVANAALAWLALGALGPAIASYCTSHAPAAMAIETSIRALCANPELTRIAVTGCVAILTILLYWQELYRGINDVGFVGATLRAERNRHRGL
jgi:membrane associated rhomboid family serine protease